jgi:hypothetical protein
MTKEDVKEQIELAQKNIDYYKGELKEWKRYMKRVYGNRKSIHHNRITEKTP